MSPLETHLDGECDDRITGNAANKQLYGRASEHLNDSDLGSNLSETSPIPRGKLLASLSQGMQQGSP
jgi:hypothetical protein